MTTVGREVGGLWCMDVLALLSDYLDGQLDPDLSDQVRAHLAGCRECERFGTGMRALLDLARESLVDEGDEAQDPEALDHLMRALDRARGGS